MFDYIKKRGGLKREDEKFFGRGANYCYFWTSVCLHYMCGQFSTSLNDKSDVGHKWPRTELFHLDVQCGMPDESGIVIVRVCACVYLGVCVWLVVNRATGALSHKPLRSKVVQSKRLHIMALMDYSHFFTTVRPVNVQWCVQNAALVTTRYTDCFRGC